MASLNTRKAYGPWGINDFIQQVPNSPTALTTTDTRLFQIHFNNPTGGAVTFTLQDGQGVSGNIFNGISIPANSGFVSSWPEGLNCNGGVVWSSNTIGVYASVVGWYM